MDLFSNYEQEFVDTLGSLQNRLNSFPSLSTEQKLNEIKKADNEIHDAEETLESMNLNARNVVGAQGVKLQGKIKEYQGDIIKMKKEVRRAETAANESANRESLMAGSAIVLTDLNVSLDQRERLLQNNQKMTQGTTRLREARMQAEDTMEVGIQIMGNLEEQTTVMQKGMKRLSEINDKLSQSSKIISGMARRVATNKLIMAVIVLVLIGAMGLIIWLKWFKK